MRILNLFYAEVYTCGWAFKVPTESIPEDGRDLLSRVTQELAVHKARMANSEDSQDGWKFFVIRQENSDLTLEKVQEIFRGLQFPAEYIPGEQTKWVTVGLGKPTRWL